jgi:hypothetical protein
MEPGQLSQYSGGTMGWTAEKSGFVSRQGYDFFLHSVQISLGNLNQSSDQCVQEVKREGCEAGPSPPSGAEDKNAWIYTYTPLYVFNVCCLFKYTS